MIFVPTEMLKPGMCLKRDLVMANYKKSDLLMFKRGEKLTGNLIGRLKHLKVQGLYIDDGFEDEIKMTTLIDDDIKQKATEGLVELFDKAGENNGMLDKESMANITDVAEDIVDNISKYESLPVGIVELQTYDINTYAHSLSVSVLSIAIGTSMGMDKETLERLGVCALIHDIGKLDIPAELISKPAKLTDEEFLLVKGHAVKGEKYLSVNEFLDPDIHSGVVSHHEKYDGSGYPLGLKGENISLFARIIAVADVYDALTGNRPYREPNSPSEAIEFVMGNCDVHFDAEVVNAFLRKVAPYPVGCPLELSDGSLAIVVKQTPMHPLRPVVRIMGTKSLIIDLYKNPKARNLIIKNIKYDYMRPQN